jgi:hypothetical protein
MVGRIAEISTINLAAHAYSIQLIGPLLQKLSIKKAILDHKMGSFPPPMGYFGSPVWPILGACS